MLPFFKRQMVKINWLSLTNLDSISEESSEEDQPEEMPKDSSSQNDFSFERTAMIYRISWCDFKIVTRIYPEEINKQNENIQNKFNRY